MAIKTRKQTKIEARLAKMEREAALLLRQVSKQTQTPVREVTPASVAYLPLTRQELREQLLARGITRSPSPEELAIVTKWKSRPKRRA